MVDYQGFNIPSGSDRAQGPLAFRNIVDSIKARFERSGTGLPSQGEFEGQTFVRSSDKSVWVWASGEWRRAAAENMWVDLTGRLGAKWSLNTTGGLTPHLRVAGETVHIFGGANVETGVDWYPNIFNAGGIPAAYAPAEAVYIMGAASNGGVGPIYLNLDGSARVISEYWTIRSGPTFVTFHGSWPRRP